MDGVHAKDAAIVRCADDRMKMPIRLLILLEGRHTPSSRLRIMPYVEMLAREGYVCTVAVIPKMHLKRIGMLFKAWTADIVIVQKKLFRRWELRLLLWAGAKLIYDYDDAVMAVPDFVVRSRERFRVSRQRRFRATIEQCDWVIAGNEYLASAARVITDRVSVMPTMVQIERYPQAQRVVMTGEPVIGWIGTRGNLGYLESLRSVFDDLHRAHPRVRVKVICDVFPDLGSIPQTRVHWSERGEVEALADVNIGIMPLTETEWTRGKNGYKLLQYMACGIAVVASPVGVNRTLVEHGRNGFLAESEAEWAQMLTRLITTPALRDSMGREGRKTVEQSYTIAHGWPILAAAVRHVTDASHEPCVDRAI